MYFSGVRESSTSGLSYELTVKHQGIFPLVLFGLAGNFVYIDYRVTPGKVETS